MISGGRFVGIRVKEVLVLAGDTGSTVNPTPRKQAEPSLVFVGLGYVRKHNSIVSCSTSPKRVLLSQGHHSALARDLPQSSSEVCP